MAFLRALLLFFILLSSPGWAVNSAPYGNAGRVAAYLDSQTVTAGTDFACVLSTLSLLQDRAGLIYGLSQLHSAMYSGFTLLQEHLIFRLTPAYKTRMMQCSGPWFSFLGDFTRQEKVEDYVRNGYRTASEGFILGWNEDFQRLYSLGVCGMFAHNNITWGDRIAYGSKWDVFLAVYGFFARILDLSLLGGYGNAEATRFIHFSDIYRSASHNHNDWMWDAHIGLRYPLETLGLVFSPFVELDFVNDYQSSYKEKGADSLNLEVKSKYANLLRSEVGAYLLFNHFFEVKLDYVYNYRMAGDKIEAKMEGANGYFSVDGLNPNGSIFEYNLALLFERQRGGINVGYGGLIGETFFDQHFTLRIEGCF